MINDQHIVRLILDSSSDTLTMLRPQRNGPENKKVKRSLQMCAVFAVSPLSYRHSTQVFVTLGRMSTRISDARRLLLPEDDRGADCGGSERGQESGEQGRGA